METTAFRIWDKERKKFWDSGSTPSMLKSFFENTAVLHTRDEMPYQQYTGLSDKNGVWIYEGDFYKCTDCENCRGFHQIEWETSKGSTGMYDVIGFAIPEKEMEIIGNIYENPELLK